MIVQALGGLGLFLLGMIIMTEGLRELAGDMIRSALMRFTSSPVTGAATGAISTAILQSSSATTVAAVGFVGAGLMTFDSSLGIVFGANHKDKRADLTRMQIDLDETHSYLDAIQLQGSTDASWDRMLDLIHALDHMQRMHERCEEDEDRAITARETGDLSIMHEMLATLVSNTIESLKKESWGDMVQLSRQPEQAISQQVGPQRDNIAAYIADGRMTVPEATDCLEAIRWLNRVGHHVARINYHLHKSLLASGK